MVFSVGTLSAELLLDVSKFNKDIQRLSREVIRLTKAEVASLLVKELDVKKVLVDSEAIANAVRLAFAKGVENLEIDRDSIALDFQKGAQEGISKVDLDVDSIAKDAKSAFRDGVSGQGADRKAIADSVRQGAIDGIGKVDINERKVRGQFTEAFKAGTEETGLDEGKLSQEFKEAFSEGTEETGLSKSKFKDIVKDSFQGATAESGFRINDFEDSVAEAFRAATESVGVDLGEFSSNTSKSFSDATQHIGLDVDDFQENVESAFVDATDELGVSGDSFAAEFEPAFKIATQEIGLSDEDLTSKFEKTFTQGTSKTGLDTETLGQSVEEAWQTATATTGLRKEELAASISASFSSGIKNAVSSSRDLFRDLASGFSRFLREGVSKGLGTQIKETLFKLDTKGFEKSLSDAIKRASDSVSGDGLFGGLIRSFQQGIGQGLGFQYASGISSALADVGVDLEKLGAKGTRLAARVGKSAGDRVAQRFGIIEGLEGVPAEIEKVRNLFNEIIDEKEISRKVSVLELQLGKLIDDLVEAKGLGTIGANIGAISRTGQDIASAPVQGLKERRSRILKDYAVNEAIQRSKDIDLSSLNISPEAQKVVFGIGGFAGNQGKSSQGVAEKLQILAGSQAAVIPVENTFTDISASFEDGIVKYFRSVLEKFTTTNVQGFNPDAIEAAAQAIAVRNQTGKDVAFAGYSGGGYVAQEATEILKAAGINSRGVGIGTPRFGATTTTTPNQFSAVLGRKDPLSKASRKADAEFFDIGGTGHKLSEYLGSVDTQLAILSKLGLELDTVPEIKSPVTYDVSELSDHVGTLFEDAQKLLSDPAALDLLRKTGAYNETLLKRIQIYRKKIRESVGKAVGTTQDYLIEVDSSLYELELFTRTLFNDSGATEAPVKGLDQTGKANFAVIASEVAKASGTGLSKDQLPSVLIDNKRLDTLGSDAFYDISRNQILIRESFAEILQGNISDVEEVQNAFKSIIHEMRHAFQFNFGATQLDDIANGGQAGISLIPFDASSRLSQINALRSVQDAKDNSSVLGFSLLGRNTQGAIARTESDAYEFTSRNLKKIQKAALPQFVSPGDFLDPFSDASGLVDYQARSFEDLNIAPQTGLKSRPVSPELLADYNVKVLREINRLIGGKGKGNRDELVKEILDADLKDVRKAIDEVEKRIERGPNGGQTLKPRGSSNRESLGISRARDTEKRLRDTLLEFQKLEGKRREEIAALALREIDITTKSLDNLIRTSSSVTTRSTAGSLKGRITGLIGNFKGEKVDLEPIDSPIDPADIVEAIQDEVESVVEGIGVDGLIANIPDFKLDPETVVSEIVQLVAGIPAEVLQVATDEIVDSIPDFGAIANATKQAISQNREDFLQDVNLESLGSDNVDPARISRRTRADIRRGRLNKKVRVERPQEPIGQTPDSASASQSVSPQQVGTQFSKEELALRRQLEQLLNLLNSGKVSQREVQDSLRATFGGEGLSLAPTPGLATGKEEKFTLPENLLKLQRLTAGAFGTAEALGFNAEDVVSIVRELESGFNAEGVFVGKQGQGRGLGESKTRGIGGDVDPSFQAAQEEERKRLEEEAKKKAREAKKKKYTVELRNDPIKIVSSIVKQTADAVDEQLGKLPKVLTAEVDSIQFDRKKNRISIPKQLADQIEAGGISDEQIQEIVSFVNNEFVKPQLTEKVETTNAKRLGDRTIDVSKVYDKVIRSIFEDLQLEIDRLPDAIEIDGARPTFDGEKLGLPKGIIERFQQGIIDAADIEGITRALNVLPDPTEGLVNNDLLNEYQGLGQFKSLPRIVAADVPRAEVSKDRLDLRVPQATFERIGQGQLTTEDIQDIVRAVRSAVNAKDEKLRLTAQESAKYAVAIERQVAGTRGGNRAKQVARTSEADAVAFASRTAPAIRERVLKSAAVDQFETSLGLGGAGADIAVQDEVAKAFERLRGTAEQFAVDLEEELGDSQTAIAESADRLRSVLEQAANIEILPADAILSLQDEVIAQVKAIQDEINSALSEFDSIAQAKPDQVRSQLFEYLKGFSPKELNPIAQEFGIETTAVKPNGKTVGRKRADIAQELVNTADLRQLQPQVFAVTRAQVQRREDRNEKIRSAATTARDVITAPIKFERAAAATVTNALDEVGDAFLRFRDNEAVTAVTNVLGAATVKSLEILSQLQAAEVGLARKINIPTPFGQLPAGRIGLAVKDNIIAPSLITKGLTALPGLGGAIGQGIGAFDNLIQGGVNSATTNAFGGAESFISNLLAPSEFVPKQVEPTNFFQRTITGFENAIGNATNAVGNFAAQAEKNVATGALQKLEQGTEALIIDITPKVTRTVEEDLALGAVRQSVDAAAQNVVGKSGRESDRDRLAQIEKRLAQPAASNDSTKSIGVQPTSREARDSVTALKKGIEADIKRLKAEIIAAEKNGQGVNREIAELRSLISVINETEQIAVALRKNLGNQLKGGDKTSFTASEKSFASRKSQAFGLLERAQKQNSKAKTTGEDLAAGAAEGIKLKSAAVDDAADSMAEQALEAVRERWQIQSPSRVTAEYGAFFVQGVPVGVGREVGKAEAAISSAFGSLNTTAETALGQVNLGDIKSVDLAAPAPTPTIANPQAAFRPSPARPGITSNFGSVAQSPTDFASVYSTDIEKQSKQAIASSKIKKSLDDAIAKTKEQIGGQSSFTVPVNIDLEEVGNVGEDELNAILEEKKAELQQIADTAEVKLKVDFAIDDESGQFSPQISVDEIKAVGPIEAIGKAFDFAGKQIDQFEGFLNNLTPGLGNIVPLAKQAIGAFVGFQILEQVGPAIANFTRQSLDAAKNLDALRISLDQSAGSSVAGGRDLAFIRDQVDSLNIPLQAAQEGFKSLRAATRGTALEGSTVEDLQLGLSQAVASLSLDEETAGRAFQAVQQIASKGKLSAEELRQQLSEAVPGAFQIAARALGVSEAELNKQLELGQVTAEDFLPKFGRQLQQEFGSGAEAASQTAQGQINRLNNEVLKFQENFGKSIQPAQIAVLSSASSAIEGLTENFELLARTAQVLGVVVLSKVLPPLLSFAPVAKGLALIRGAFSDLGSAAIKFATDAKYAQAATTGFLKSALSLLKAAAPLIAISAGIEAISVAFETSRPSEFGRSMEEMAGRSVKSLTEVQNALDKTKKKIDDARPDAKGFDLSLGLGGLVGFGDALNTDTLQYKGRDLLGVKDPQGDALLKEARAEASRQKQLDLSGLSGIDRAQRLQSLGLRDRRDAIVQNNPVLRAIDSSTQFNPAVALANSLNPFKRTGAEKIQIKDIQATDKRTAATKELVDGIRDRVPQLTQEIQGVADIDKEIRGLTSQRETLRKQPQADQGKVRELDLQIKDAQERRRTAADGFNTSSSKVQQEILGIEQNIEDVSKSNLKEADKSILIGDLSKQRDDLIEIAKTLQDIQNSAGTNVNPLLNLILNIEKLNLELSKTQEISRRAFSEIEANAAQQTANQFTTNRNAPQEQAVTVARARVDQTTTDLGAQTRFTDQLRSELQNPEIDNALQSVFTGKNSKLTRNSTLTELEQGLAATPDLEQNKKRALESFIALRKAEEQQTALQKEQGDARLQLRQSEEALQVKQISDASAQRQSAIEQAAATETAIVKQQQKDRVIGEEDAQVKLSEIALMATSEKIRADKEELAATQAKYDQGLISAETFAQTQLRLNGQLAQGQQQLADQTLQLEEAKRASILATLDLANQQAAAAIEISKTDRTTQIQQRVVTGDLTQEQAGALTANLEIDATGQSIDDAKRRLKEVQDLEASGVKSKRQSQIEQIAIQKEIANLNQQAIANEINLQRALRAEIDATLAKRKEDLALVQSTAEVDLLGSVVSTGGPQSESQFQLQQIAIQQDFSVENVDAIREAIAQLDALGLTDEETQRRRIQLQTELNAAQKTVYEQELSRQQALRDAIDQTLQIEQSRLNLAQAQGSAAIALQTVAVQSTGVPFDQGSFKLRQEESGLKNQLQARQDEIGLIEEAISQLDALGFTDEKTQRQRIALQQQLAQAQEGVSSLQLQQIENSRAQQALAVDRLVAANNRTSDLAVTGIESRISAGNALTQNLESQNRLLQAQQRLIEAIASARTQGVQLRIDAVDQNIADAQAQGDDKKVAKLQEEKGRLGVRLVEEQIRAQEELRDLASRQLEIEQEKERVAGRIALQEAKIAELKAKSAAFEAAGNLRKAQISGDTEAIASAQVALVIAQQQVSLAEQKTGLTRENIAVNDELAKKQKQAFDIEQETSRRSLEGQLSTARRQAARDLGETDTSKYAINQNTGRNGTGFRRVSRGETSSDRAATRGISGYPDTPALPMALAKKLGKDSSQSNELSNAIAAVPPQLNLFKDALTSLNESFATLGGLNTEQLGTIASSIDLISPQIETQVASIEALNTALSPLPTNLQNFAQALVDVVNQVSNLASIATRDTGGTLSGLTWVAEKRPEIVDYGSRQELYTKPTLLSPPAIGRVLHPGATQRFLQEHKLRDIGGTLRPVAGIGATIPDSISFSQLQEIQQSSLPEPIRIPEEIRQYIHGPHALERPSISIPENYHVSSLANPANSAQVDPNAKRGDALEKRIDRLTSVTARAMGTQRELHIHSAQRQTAAELYNSFLHAETRRSLGL